LTDRRTKHNVGSVSDLAQNAIIRSQQLCAQSIQNSSICRSRTGQVRTFPGSEHLLATPFHHHHIKDFAFVPPAQPTYSPSVNAIA
jgi:hypothetical protein